MRSSAQWTVRIDARVVKGGLTGAEATTLKTQAAAKAKAMVDQTGPGGMQGAAVGAGPGAAAGNGAGKAAGNGAGFGAGTGHGAGTGPGDGTCDGSGRQGRMAP